MARASRSRAPSITTAELCSSNDDVAVVAASMLDRGGCDFVEAYVFERAGLDVAAGEFDDVGHERAELLGLIEQVGQQTSTGLRGERLALFFDEDFEVRTQGRDRRAQLVRGVGDELALSGDGAGERLSRLGQPVEHPVEALREFADFVVGGDRDAACQVVCFGDVVDRVRDRAQRRGDTACHRAGEDHGKPDAAQAHGQQNEPQAAEQRVDRVQRAGELHCALAVAERHGEDPQPDVTSGLVAQRGLPQPGGDLSVDVVDGNAV